MITELEGLRKLNIKHLQDERNQLIRMQRWKSKGTRGIGSHKGKGKGVAKNKIDQESLKDATKPL